MKKTILALLILGISLESSAFFSRKKEFIEVKVTARAQYLGELRGFSQFHLDHVKLLEAPEGFNKEALQEGLKSWIGGRSDARLQYRACDGQALIIMKIDKRDLSETGQIEYETVAEIELMQCKKK